MPSSNSRVALITGANKGIGLEIARQVGATGVAVLVGARDADRGEAAAAQLRNEGIDARFVRVDVTDPASLAAAAAQVEADPGRLDVLVNNAGIVFQGDASPGQAAIEAVRRTFETNFFGALATVQAMLPLLKRSSSARIVNVSSGLGSLTRQSDPDWEFAAIKAIGYCGSKVALNMMTVQLAYELRDSGIKVNSADPGYTATDLNQHRGTQPVAKGAEAAVRLALLDDDGPTGGVFNAEGRQPW